MAVVGDDEQRRVARNRRGHLADRLVEPAVEVEEALVARRRRVGVLVPEVVVQAVALGDHADEQIPRLVAQELQVDRAARGERAIERVEERVRPLIRVLVVDVDLVVVRGETSQ